MFILNQCTQRIRLMFSILFMVFVYLFSNPANAADGILGHSVLDWPTGVTVYKPAKCFNGYTVFTPYRSGVVFMIDMSGRVVHTWKTGTKTNEEGWFFERLKNGNWLTMNLITLEESDMQDPEISFRKRLNFAQSTNVVEMDWDGKIIWKYTSPKGWTFHHDMARLDNGNTLILVEKRIKAPHISKKEIAENFIIEVTTDKKIVWKWYASKHFDEFGYNDEAIQGMRQNGGDIFHHNTLEVLPENDLGKTDSRFRPGNILSCQRSTGLIYIIDKKTKKVVWKWGTGKNGLVGPHHPTMLANGNILIYDNGGQHSYPRRVRFYTRLVEMNPLTGKIVWQYRNEPYIYKETAKFLATSWGSVQRFPNGNTLSLDTHKGRIFEVTPGGEIVWEYVNPFSWGRGGKVVDAGIYRVYRYSYDQIPQVPAVFPDTDGHVGVVPAKIKIPAGMGMPLEN